jgi:hypothetical protein
MSDKPAPRILVRAFVLLARRVASRPESSWYVPFRRNLLERPQCRSRANQALRPVSYGKPMNRCVRPVLESAIRDALQSARSA